MNLYLDTSVLVSLFVSESRTDAIMRLISAEPVTIFVSDFAVGEFGAAIMGAARTGRLKGEQAGAVLDDCDAWTAGASQPVEISSHDIRRATLYVRRNDFALTLPDALHLAICARLGAHLVTGDKRQAEAAVILGIDGSFL